MSDYTPSEMADTLSRMSPLEQMAGRIIAEQQAEIERLIIELAEMRDDLQIAEAQRDALHVDRERLKESRDAKK